MNNPSGRLTWTPDMDSQLRRSVAEGRTMQQISDVLGGPSRCAVAGRMKRLGIKSKNAPVRPVGSRKRKMGSKSAVPRQARQNPRLPGIMALPKARKGPYSAFGATNIAHRMETRAKAVSFVDKPEPAAPHPPRMVALADLARADCRWPIGDPREPSFGFCGHVREPGKSYCPHHVGLAYSMAAA